MVIFYIFEDTESETCSCRPIVTTINLINIVCLFEQPFCERSWYIKTG